MKQATRLLLVLLLPLALPGCIEDIVRARINVDPADGANWIPDSGLPDGDLGGSDLSLTLVKPGHGPFVGGTTVVLTGSGFTRKTVVTFGGKAVQDNQKTLLSPLFLQVVTPAGEVGKADVQVSLDGHSAKLTGGYVFDRVYMDPNSGPTAGGTLVTIHGKDPGFTKGIKLTLGGKPMTGVEVISASSIRALTPAGSTGEVDLVMSVSGGQEQTYGAAYSYYYAANPRSGGLGGGPLKGTLTVTILNNLTRRPVEGARVVMQKARSYDLKSVTGASGEVVFTHKDLTGPVSVTSGKTGFESSSILSFDARDLTLFLSPIPKPQPGPMPPGPSPGYIQGHLMFGGATGVGSNQWKLVPEPKSNQVKRAYVFTAYPSVSWGAPYWTSGDVVNYTGNGARAWPFSLYSYTGSMAIYAVAGIYTQTSGEFEPYAMGVTRGVAVGPREYVNADIWVTIPLTEKVTVELKDLPEGAPLHKLTLAIDLGADGLIMRPDLVIKGQGQLKRAVLGRLPAFNHRGLTDATYTVEVVLDTGAESGVPLSQATESLMMPRAGVLTIDRFVGLPRQVKPLAGGVLQGNTLTWANDGAAANLSLTVIRTTDQTPVWRVLAPAKAVQQMQLPDPATYGLPAWPRGTLVWRQWIAYLPGFNYNNYNYTHLYSRYWTRWSHDEFKIQVE